MRPWRLNIHSKSAWHQKLERKCTIRVSATVADPRRRRPMLPA
ncbi:TPA: hypothetical protein HA273_01865, partial [Candidatus Bathyarchaeota archaeon]|nr:hypothetical protein [Candidatus Bathyarchaeota archaeon]